MKKITLKPPPLPNLSKLAARLAVGVLLLSLLPALPASASQITSRSLTLGTSVASTSTTDNYKFTVPSSTTIKSATFQYCTASSGTCTTPTGLTSTSATLSSTSNLGSGGTWTGTFTTNGTLKIANASNTGSPSANITVNFSSVTNPSTVAPFYVLITTYSDSAWTTPIDTGTVAGAVANQISVTASVSENLDFCAFQTGSTCGGGSGTTVSLGALSSSAATTGTSVLIAGTNATTGYTIQYTGATLAGAGTIAATGTTGATSSTGSAQFGINVANNTSPTVGAAPSGGTGTGSTNYATANTFSFVASTLTQIASASGTTADTLYTVSYLANIPANQTAGAYSTTLTYICTATF
ncbi:MAG TPA: hypothetical protein VMR75_00460 [Candidatus Saccharimonadales bacterium]|nr:hypothetical protein [Candidatus Saccharimonadales bacterium]